MTHHDGNLARTGANAQFTVEVIDTFPAFEAIRAAWTRLMEQDSESSVFLSWDWLAEAFRDNPYRWSVLIARHKSEPDEIACILPLKYRVHWSRTHKEFHTELEAGGRLLWSEYTGFVCDPRWEEPALTAVATELAHMPWARLSMRYVAQPRRAEIFTGALERSGFSVSWKEYTINKGQTNNLICPTAWLPEDFDTYLKTQISANTRQQLSRFRRRNLDTGEMRFTQATDESFERDLGILIGFWKQRWAEEKTPEQVDQVAENYSKVLSVAHKTGNLFLPVLWHGDQPLGALGHVLDHPNGIAHFVVAGRDVTSKFTFVGSALHFHSIEWAISQGYLAYDFCHGNEQYKYSYGVSEQEVLYFSVRRTDYAQEMMFDSIGTGEALRRTAELIERGKTRAAKIACRKLAGLLS